MRVIENDAESLFSVKTNEGNLVADVRQYAIMRERMESDFQELQVISST